jgi:hypothetical protein
MALDPQQLLNFLLFWHVSQKKQGDIVKNDICITINGQSNIRPYRINQLAFSELMTFSEYTIS